MGKYWMDGVGGYVQYMHVYISIYSIYSVQDLYLTIMNDIYMLKQSVYFKLYIICRWVDF